MIGEERVTGFSNRSWLSFVVVEKLARVWQFRDNFRRKFRDFVRKKSLAKMALDFLFDSGKHPIDRSTPNRKAQDGPCRYDVASLSSLSTGATYNSIFALAFWYFDRSWRISEYSPTTRFLPISLYREIVNELYAQISFRKFWQLIRNDNVNARRNYWM